MFEKGGSVKIHFFTDYMIKKTKDEIICENNEDAIIGVITPCIKKNPKWFQIESFELEEEGFTYCIKMQTLQKGERHKRGIDTVTFYVIKEKEKDEDCIWRGKLETPYEGDLISQVREHGEWKPLTIYNLAPKEVLEILFRKLIETEEPIWVKLPDEIINQYKK